MYKNLTRGKRELNVTANYTYWKRPEAAPDNPEYNCMQLLSGTDYNGAWMTRDCEDDLLNVRALCQLK